MSFFFFSPSAEHKRRNFEECWKPSSWRYWLSRTKY